jgi:CRP-like cAMP-binding protein
LLTPVPVFQTSSAAARRTWLQHRPVGRWASAQGLGAEAVYMTFRGTPVRSCVHCPIGVAAGVGRGGVCPLDPGRVRDHGLIYAEGAPADAFWFVKRGLVALGRRRGAEEVGHTVVPAGGLVGVEALACERYRDTARAAGDAVLCAGSREVAEGWLGAPRSPARALVGLVIASRVLPAPRAAGIEASATTRLSRWLAESAEDGCVPPLSRRVLASLLGMTPETLSRAMTRLVAAGAVARQGLGVLIVDAEALSGLASGARPALARARAAISVGQPAGHGADDRPGARRHGVGSSALPVT